MAAASLRLGESGAGEDGSLPGVRDCDCHHDTYGWSQPARQGPGKEHEIGVINSRLSPFNAELITNVKGWFFHLPCHRKGFTASL